MNACDCLPICAIVNDVIFAVHAGISPLLDHVEDIDKIDRFHEIPLISFFHIPFILFPLFSTRDCSVTYYGLILHWLMVGTHQIVG